MLRTRISTSGQVNILAEIREKLEVKPGDSVLWRIDDEGKMEVDRVNYIFEELRGIAPYCHNQGKKGMGRGEGPRI